MNRPNTAERGGVPAVRENTEGVVFSDLGETSVTRARAIKLAGAALAGGAFSVFWAGEAEARPNRKKRRRKRRLRARRRRQARQDAVTANPSTVDFGSTPEGVAPATQPVTVTNDSDTPVTVTPVVGDGFTLVAVNGIPVVPGNTITLNPGNNVLTVGLDAAEQGVQTGELKLLDARDGLLLETVDLTGNVTAPVGP